MEMIDKLLPYVGLAGFVLALLQFLLTRKSKAERENLKRSNEHLKLTNESLKAELAQQLKTTVHVKFISGSMEGTLLVQNIGHSSATDVTLVITSDCFFELKESDRCFSYIAPQDTIRLTVQYNDHSQEILSTLNVSWTNASGERTTDIPYEVRFL